MDFDEIENLNPEQILDMYEDILETPVKISLGSCYYYTSYATGSTAQGGDCMNIAAK